MRSIEGQCDPRFEKVREAFAANFESRGEVGAATAATLNGRPVVDLWTGHAEPALGRGEKAQRSPIKGYFSAFGPKWVPVPFTGDLPDRA